LGLCLSLAHFFVRLGEYRLLAGVPASFALWTISPFRPRPGLLFANVSRGWKAYRRLGGRAAKHTDGERYANDSDHEDSNTPLAVGSLGAEAAT
jgi:hypothetical protein